MNELCNELKQMVEKFNCTIDRLIDELASLERRVAALEERRCTNE